MTHRFSAVVAGVVALAFAGCGDIEIDTSGSASPDRSSFASCSSYDSQKEAIEAWKDAGSPADRDRDGDGKVCENLSSGSGQGASGSGGTAKTTNCRRVDGVVDIAISKTKSPQTLRHVQDAIAKGYPAVLTIDRAGADDNREQSLAGIATKDGFQRDEYPPAMSKEGGVAEIGPMKGKRADVRLIPSADNSSSGASMGVKLRQYCDGQKFRIIGF